MRPLSNLFLNDTYDISCNNSVLTMVKYADDMAFAGRLKYKFSLSEYHVIDLFTCQFKSSFFLNWIQLKLKS